MIHRLVSKIRYVQFAINYFMPAELMDITAIRNCNTYDNLSYAEKPTLFLEFNGSEAAVKDDAESVGESCQS